MKTIFSCILIFICSCAFAGGVKWSVSGEPLKAFIENNPELAGIRKLPGDVLFATEEGSSQILFSKTGLTYILKKIQLNDAGQRVEIKPGMTHEELEEAEHRTEITTASVKMIWKNANANADILGIDDSGAPYFYNSRNGSMKAKTFRKIIYRNLYPNIDVEYVFHKESGIKYSFILHPGADPSRIGMNWSGMDKVFTDADGNLHLPTLFGDIMDHAPESFYSDSRNVISSAFIVRNKTISFSISAYDASRQVIIDPWTVTPSMGNSNKVFNIESDSIGNAYVYGGDSPYKLQKYDPSGNLVWTFTNGWDSSSYWCGTLIVDRAGNSYITAGSSAEITKVNTGGSQVWTQSGGLLDEYWSMAFNCDETELVVGGTRLTGIPIITGSGRAYNIDLTSGNVINSIRVSNAIPSFLINDPNEIRSVCASPNGNYYFLTLDTIGSLSPALAGINWETQSGYRFGYGSPNYGFTPQGQSIIRATATHIYTANGDSVIKRDINTGAVVAAAAIPGGGHATTFLIPGTLPKNGGLAIDSCGNVYAGSQSNVTMFDANLGFISSTSTPSAVYDVAIGTNGDVLACGNGFAAALTIPACSQIHLNCNTAIPPVAAFSAPNTICPGTCTGFTNMSSNATSFVWYFPGANPSTSTDTDPQNICYNTPGTYDVTLVASGANGTDSLTLSNYITVYQYPPPQGISQSGDTLFANQGSNSYQWYHDGILIPGATDYFYVLSAGGNYNVVCTDSNGCEVEAVIFDVVAGISPPVADFTGIFFYPNPADETLLIDCRDFSSESISISLYNVFGEKVSTFVAATSGSGLISTDISKLPDGIYWIEFMSGNSRMRSKMIKSTVH